MLRTSLLFVAIAAGCLIFADIDITTLNPGLELRRMLVGAVTPDFAVLISYRQALLNTVVFAFCGISIGVLGGTILAFFFHNPLVRLFCAFIRAIHEIFWAFLFLPLVGLSPVCGVLAIGIPYAGIFAKVYAEIYQESNKSPLKGLPPHASAINRFFYGVLPIIYQDIKHYTSYRFECALRSSAILGFIGLPTLGYHLETAFREGHYSEAAALLYAFYLLIASLRWWLKPKVALVYVAVSFWLLSKQVFLSWGNVERFVYEILPWPMRREGFQDGSGALALPWDALGRWVLDIFTEEAWPGILATLVLTQIALALTGLLALLGFPAISRHFHRPIFRRCSHFGLIVLRTTPEYILAYIFVLWWGPSMLPAIVAIALHTSAILAYLTGQNADLVHLRADAPARRSDRYFYEILPRVYGQFLAFLFYRWEIIMRESAILGILGIYTLGFYIDSAISDQKMDKALFLILITALLNMGIDTLSQYLRRRLKISTNLVTTQQAAGD